MRERVAHINGKGCGRVKRFVDGNNIRGGGNKGDVSIIGMRREEESVREGRFGMARGNAGVAFGEGGNPEIIAFAIERGDGRFVDREGEAVNVGRETSEERRLDTLGRSRGKLDDVGIHVDIRENDIRRLDIGRDGNSAGSGNALGFDAERGGTVPETGDDRAGVIGDDGNNGGVEFPGEGNRTPHTGRVNRDGE
jgi:hypothetical protein